MMVLYRDPCSGCVFQYEEGEQPGGLAPVGEPVVEAKQAPPPQNKSRGVENNK
ncbi:hypothetical protein HHJ78_10875 [Mobiluncus mulieris]|uniref:Uncharacterized protein n=1 Tax=Mobiluncus mulieris TaxID=2052 RepID=A0A7Y0Y5A2_9ACTO|nr:hypothetical protein [Mobiluncus mulieris]NMW65987.1 hypothetical protein [Mobiluncus mulieris]